MEMVREILSEGNTSMLVVRAISLWDSDWQEASLIVSNIMGMITDRPLRPEKAMCNL